MCQYCGQLVETKQIAEEICDVITQADIAAVADDTVPGDVTTTSSISVGQTITGALNYVGDRDWYAIDLAAGEEISIALNGVSLSDPYLRVYDAAGNLIDFNDDADSGIDSYLDFTASTAGTYYLSAGAYDDSETGTFELSVTGSAPTPPATLLDAITWGGAAMDDSDAIQVYFALSGTSVNDEGTTIVSDGFSATEIDRIMEIFDNISTFADIEFVQTTNAAAADITLATSDLGTSLLGYMYPQGSSVSSDGLGVFNSNDSVWNVDSLAAGGFMNSVISHELGHGLGLAHTHDVGGGSAVMNGVASDTDLGDYGLNQCIYTIMSYNDGWVTNPLGGPSDDGYGYVFGFAALDMAVLQSYYGANTTHASGNDNYIIGEDRYYQAIWDTGGTDSIRAASTVTAGVNVDLRAATLAYEAGGGGFISHATDDHSGFTIANGVEIERAFGSRFDDQLRGNGLANVIGGAAGDDTVYGVNGNDLLYGGDGDDFVFGGNGADRAYGGNDNDYVSGGAGNDRLYGSFGNDRVYGGDGADLISGGADRDILYGGNDRDFIYGDDGNDILVGGNHADNFYGGAGADRLIAGHGHDKLTGGADADVFVFHSYARGNNQVLDFEDGLDLIEMRGVGGGYGALTITQSGANTVIEVDSISIALVGVDSSTITADDFIFA